MLSGKRQWDLDYAFASCLHQKFRGSFFDEQAIKNIDAELPLKWD